MSEPVQLISLGAGVQSSTMALMAAKGEITPMPQAAIFADTQAEPKAVYDWLERLIPMLPYPVYKVSKGNLETEILKRRVNQKTGNPYYSTYIPAFVTSPNGRGILRRKCTHDFKILQLIRKQAELVGKDNLRAWRKAHKAALDALKEWKAAKATAKRNKTTPPIRPEWAWQECQNDALAIVWIGISLDEASRIKDSTVPWARSRWPLTEQRITRKKCLNWLELHGYPEAPKSACRWCPYHNDEQWRLQKENTPDEFAKSVAFEKALQKICADGGAREVPYLHDSLVPLDKVNFDRPSHEQGSLFNNECEGMCGV